MSKDASRVSPPLDQYSASGQSGLGQGQKQNPETAPRQTKSDHAPKSPTEEPGKTSGKGKPPINTNKPKVSPAQQYVNPDRHLTGGPSREKLSKHELDARIERARLNNQAIMKRRELVEKDKDQYSQITQKERQERKERARKAVETKKIQLAIDDEREKSRARKLEKLDKRDWDSEKAGQDGLWQSNYKAYSKEERPKPKQLVPWG